MATPKAERLTPNVGYVHPSYAERRPDWDLISAFCNGSRAVKALGDRVLPRPDPLNKSPDNNTRFLQYLDRAVFYPVPQRTLEGYVGQVFADPPVVKLPKRLEMLEMDVDGAGVSVVQQASKALSYVVSRGRCALLADYPTSEPGATQAEVEAMNLRPTVTLYEPESVINWRTEQFGGVTKLVLVVIHESLCTKNDGFEQQYRNSWRVLSLDDMGLYAQDVWIEDDANQGEYLIARDASTDVPMHFEPMQNGKRMDEIPFIFVGSINNDATCDNPPMLGLVELSKGHFRNSADYEESAYQLGQPTYVATGITEDWQKANPSIPVGARSFVLFPLGATADILQAKPNTIAFEAMQHKEKQMVAVGAKLIELSKVAMTATEVMLKDGASTSSLAHMANNVSSAYEWILTRAMRFIDASVTLSPDELTVRLSTDFRTNSLEPGDQAQLVANWQAGALTDREMRSQFGRGSMTEDTFEEWQKQHEEKLKREQEMATATAAAKATPAQ